MKLTIETISKVAGTEVADPNGILDDFSRDEFDSIEKIDEKTKNGMHIIKLSAIFSKGLMSFGNHIHGGEKWMVIISDRYGKMEIFDICK